jgi:hypothetical protein
MPIKKKNPKILIGSPTSQYKDYCAFDWYKHVMSFTYPDKEIYVVDNSLDPEYHLKLKSYGLETGYVNPENKELRKTMSICNNMIRKKAIDENFDYIFSLETDQFPPRNILELLLSYKLDVIGIPYFVGQGKKSYLLMRDLTRSEMKENGKKREISFSEFNCDFINGIKEYNGTVRQVYAYGIGCMLISRDVFGKIPFRVADDNSGLHADSYFANDLFKNNIKNHMDTSVLTCHHNSDWFRVLDTK